MHVKFFAEVIERLDLSRQGYKVSLGVDPTRGPVPIAFLLILIYECFRSFPSRG